MDWLVFVCLSVCPSVRLSKHFRLWSPNGWSDRDGRIFIRCVKTTERRWCQFQADRLHVARGTCDGANRGKKVVAQGAGQTNGRIRLKLFMPIAKLDMELPLGKKRWRPLGTCYRHVPSGFIISLKATERLVRLERERRCSTGTDVGKIALPVTEGSWVRIPRRREKKLRC